MFPTTDLSSPRSELSAEALLQQVRAATPLFMASPRHTLLASEVHATVPLGAAPLAQRVRDALACAEALGAPAPVVVGAVPFDPTQAPALGVAPALRRAGALPAAAPAKRGRLPCELREVPAGATYAAAVAEAVRRIRRGEVDKVVLARTLELALDQPLELQALLAGLAARNPLGYTFSVALSGGRTLFGASPELLVSRHGGVLRANPLAGSAPRSRDPHEDRRRAQALLVSRKDLEEHRLVVDAVAQALRPLCPQLQVPSRPSLVHTPTMWHLSTEITGPTEADALTLALALHPTPAVCGFPRGRAHELIRHLEPFERDFYAGAFGWSDANGDGEWVVAIRCAELSGERRLRLFAGAGIVAESQPEAELAETSAKFRTMLDALGIAHEADQPVPAEALPMKQPHCTPWPDDYAARCRAAGHWTGQSFAGFLRDIAERHGDRTALVAGAVRWSYRQLEAESLRVAEGLAGLGISAGDRVVVQLPNRAEFFSVIFGLWRLRALPVFALPAHRKLEIGYFCRHAEAVAYVTVDRHAGFDHRELAREVQAESPTLRHVLIAGEPGPQGGFTALSALPSARLPTATAEASEVAFLQLSGGSTGTPKLIPRTADDYLYSVRESARICGLTPETIYLCVLPAAHNFALSSPGTLGVLHAGGTVVLGESAAPELAFPLIARERVTMTALVPPLVPVWLAAAASRRAELASLQLLQVGGARFDDSLARRVEPELGARLQQVFGMAEGLVNYTRHDDPPELVTQTQGRPISPDDEIRILDDDDQPVAPGEIGHLLTRGPYTIRGYYKAEQHNVRAFTADGFYRTGDLVRQLPSGHLVVEGRAKDQVNRGGEKVPAEEIEHLLMAHAGVLDVALVAMPDVHLGERSCAYVIRRDPALRAPALMQFVRAQGVAAFKVPDRIEFVDELPKTAVGKVDKKLLRQRIADKLAALAISSTPEAQTTP